MSDLEHFGIKGMHWGVRRQRADDGRVRGPSKSTRSHVSPDAARAQKSHVIVKAKGVEALSNQDLQHLVNRMNLEQQFSRLTAEPSTASKAGTRLKTGQKAIKEVIGVALMAKQVHEIANSAMVRDIKTAIEKGKKGG